MLPIHSGRTGSASMNVGEPEPSPSCCQDDIRAAPCLLDSTLAQRLVVRAPARAYVVWRLPEAACGEFDWCGLHLGESSWTGLVQSLAQGRYQSGRDHLRRLHAERGEDLIAVGRALFRAEAAKHEVPAESFKVWVWPSPSPDSAGTRSLSSTQPSLGESDPSNSQGSSR
eukprot:6491184-Amphidinium_carterae.2